MLMISSNFLSEIRVNSVEFLCLTLELKVNHRRDTNGFNVLLRFHEIASKSRTDQTPFCSHAWKDDVFKIFLKTQLWQLTRVML